MMRKAFTITELLVAVGLLAVVLTISGVVFSYSIDAQRASTAQAEIMRNLRAITDQLNADFSGRYPQSPLEITIDPNNIDGPRADNIAFYITGNFQTTRLYPDDSGDIVSGNLACVYYGQSDPNHTATDPDKRRLKVLARRQTIITSNTVSPMNLDNREYKQDSIVNITQQYLADKQNWRDEWMVRPDIDPADVDDIPMYLAKGVDEFSIQLFEAVDANGTLDWWPSTESDYKNKDSYTGSWEAIKFNFTLYDSDGIIEDGKRFEHIVYLKQ